MKDGTILSENTRMSYTISTCNLARLWLNEERKRVLDELIQIVKGLEYYENKEITIREVKNRFVKPLRENPKLNYIAFRQHIVKHWLINILNNL